MGAYFLIGLVGYAAAIIGDVFRLLFSFVSRRYSDKSIRMALQSFIAGLLIAFICLDILPSVFETKGVYFGLFMVASGIFVTVLFERRFSENPQPWAEACLYGFPEGMAIGLLFLLPSAGLLMAALSAVRRIPRANVGKSSTGWSGWFVTNWIVRPLPIAIGAFFGSGVANLLPGIAHLCLGLTGGAMLYTACGEIIPESKSMWSIICGCAGIAVGILLTEKL